MFEEMQFQHKPSSFGDAIHLAGHVVMVSDVENALLSHPAVSDAFVIGVPDPNKGEILMAYVTLKSGVHDSNEIKCELGWQAVAEIGSWVRFKDIVILDSLPKLRGSIHKLIQPVEEKVKGHFFSLFISGDIDGSDVLLLSKLLRNDF